LSATYPTVEADPVASAAVSVEAAARAAADLLKQDASTAATDVELGAAVASHEADTTAVHGIADTSKVQLLNVAQTRTKALAIQPDSDVGALALKAGATADPFKVTDAADNTIAQMLANGGGLRLTQVPASATAPELHFIGRNGGFGVGIDVAAGANDADPLRYRDFALFKRLTGSASTTSSTCRTTA
jgi:hypothetical protein